MVFEQIVVLFWETLAIENRNIIIRCGYQNQIEDKTVKREKKNQT
jgi:Zn ribbon nucleic-acid-binding protein